MVKKIERINPYASLSTAVLVGRAIELDREVEEKRRNLNFMKAELIERAARAPKDLWKDGENDSRYIDLTSVNGEVAQVLAPTPTLRDEIDVTSKIYADLRTIIRSDEKFAALFDQATVVSPVEDFRDIAEGMLEKEQLRHLLELIENDSKFKVVFRTKEKAA